MFLVQPVYKLKIMISNPSYSCIFATYFKIKIQR